MTDPKCPGCNQPIPTDPNAKAVLVAPGCQIALPMNCFIPTAVTVSNTYTCEAAIVYGWLFPLKTPTTAPTFEARYINPMGSLTFPPPGPETDASDPYDPTHKVYPATFVVYNKGPGTVSVNYYLAAPPCICGPTPGDPLAGKGGDDKGGDDKGGDDKGGDDT